MALTVGTAHVCGAMAAWVRITPVSLVDVEERKHAEQQFTCLCRANRRQHDCQYLHEKRRGGLLYLGGELFPLAETGRGCIWEGVPSHLLLALLIA